MKKRVSQLVRGDRVASVNAGLYRKIRSINTTTYPSGYAYTIYYHLMDGNDVIAYNMVDMYNDDIEVEMA